MCTWRIKGVKSKNYQIQKPKFLESSKLFLKVKQKETNLITSLWRSRLTADEAVAFLTSDFRQVDVVINIWVELFNGVCILHMLYQPLHQSKLLLALSTTEAVLGTFANLIFRAVITIVFARGFKVIITVLPSCISVVITTTVTFLFLLLLLSPLLPSSCYWSI